MKVKLPIRNLVRLNFLLALIISGYVYLFLNLSYKESSSSSTSPNNLINAFLTLGVILFIGFVNIFIVARLAKVNVIGSKLFKQNRYLLSYMTSLFTYLIAWPLFTSLNTDSAASFDPFGLFIIVLSSALVNTLIIIFQDVTLLQDQKAKADLEFSMLKASHAEAANLLLRQQIQPHFLFNALTTLKSLYRVDADKGDTYIVHLAGFLRASFFNSEATVSTLQQELDILNDYLEMQKIRFGNALNCNVDVNEKTAGDFYLPSFSLQPLLENAIKHNDLTEEMPLYVVIKQVDDHIIITNNLQLKRKVEASTNSGLSNLTERYRLRSGDEVLVKKTETEFQVSIKLLGS